MLFPTEPVDQTFASPVCEPTVEKPSVAAVQYWRQRLAGIPPALELPADRLRSFPNKFRLGREITLYSSELAYSLQRVSETEGVPLPTTLLAAFAILLSRYTAQTDVVLGLLGGVFAGELEVPSRTELAVLRTNLEGDPSFLALLRQVRESLDRDGRQAATSFERLVQNIAPERDPQNDPLFRIAFSSSPAESLPSRAGLDLALTLHNRPESFLIQLDYNAELYDAVTIRRFLGHFQTLLEGIAAHPNECVSSYPLLGESERRELLFDWNDTRREYPSDQCIHQLFEEQVKRTADAVAVVSEGQELTYGDLNTRANQLAHCLLKLGTKPDDLVGICVHRSADMVAGLLGILKAGAAYVPLDPQYPSNRLSLMLDDSGLAILVTEERLRGNFPDFKGHVVCLDSESLVGESAANSPTNANPENLAYVIYTSGSTGRPKGVGIPHRALVNFLSSMRATPGLSAKDTLVAVTTIAFDIAALEVYLPLTVGARLVVASRETATDGARLQQLLASAAATVMQATPATWRLLLEEGWDGPSNLKILCGGEAMPPELVPKLLERSSELWNMYGPTETTVWSTVSRITSAQAAVTIGRPIANTDLYVLDSHLQPVPIGVAGELYIGGDGVARGYLHRPDLTAERFVAHPFRDGGAAQRLYRTGDLARYRADGNVECLGRIDNQVKIRGFRIELGEIELALHDCPGIRQNVVVAREDVPGNKQLVAYLVREKEEAVTAEAIQTFLKTKVPEYMIPSRFVFLELLPLTPNGKVDRRALPNPDIALAPQQKARVPAANDTEAELVKLWETVLHVRGIGVTDNFFELGGHSLLVAQLLRRIDQAFHKKLSMAVLFGAPTIQQQAALLQDQGSLTGWPSAVIPVQPVGSKPPLFCFGFDAGPVFLPLARSLGRDQPLYAVDPNLLAAPHLHSASRLDDVAVCLADEIVAFSPNGPYYLGGFCGGGLLAFETARQLLSRGREVGVVALFEPHTSSEDRLKQIETSKLRRLLAELRYHFTNLRMLRFAGSVAYVRSRPRLSLRYLQRRLWTALTRLRPHRAPAAIPDVRETLTLAMNRYQAKSINAPVVLFQAARREPGGEWEQEYWRRLARDLEVHEIPGYSNWVASLLGEPNAEILARKLAPLLPLKRAGYAG